MPARTVRVSRKRNPPAVGREFFAAAFFGAAALFREAGFLGAAALFGPEDGFRAAVVFRPAVFFVLAGFLAPAGFFAVALARWPGRLGFFEPFLGLGMGRVGERRGGGIGGRVGAVPLQSIPRARCRQPW